MPKKPSRTSGAGPRLKKGGGEVSIRLEQSVLKEQSRRLEQAGRPEQTGWREKSGPREKTGPREQTAPPSRQRAPGIAKPSCAAVVATKGSAKRAMSQD